MRVRIGTIRELFDFDLWANRQVFACTDGLSDAPLDQPFEMGEGSLRKTIAHIYAAGRIWYDRWNAPGRETLEPALGIQSLPRIIDAAERLHATRGAWLATLSDETLDASLNYTNWKGEPCSNKLGHMLLHVVNHGTHHRAQAVNMLRRLGAPVPKPGPDYIFMKLGQADQPPPPLDVDTLQTYFAYADWARDTVHQAAAPLSDADLDRPFEMGIGTLRKTLLHIHEAEAWWMDNWLDRPRAFAMPTDTVSIRELMRRFAETATARNDFLAALNDAALTRIVTAKPRPDITRTFPLGVTMLQLCGHGTHHRAQAANMLRHAGIKAPALDVLAWLKMW